MKRGVYLAFALGLGTMVTLIVVEGVGSIAALFATAGAPLLLLVPLQGLPLLLDVLGWRILIERRVRLVALFGIASVRQAINRLLPVANVGGDLVGIRLLVQMGVDGPPAAASVIVELMIALGAQSIFAVLGAACALLRSRDVRLLQGLALGFGLSLPALAVVLIVLLRGQIFHRVEQLAIRHLGGWTEGCVARGSGVALDACIREILARPSRLLASLGWQLAGVIAGASETWFALYLLGHPVGIAAAIALESLTQAARSALFVIPAGLGVQEAGLIGLGHCFGLDADTALALSLAKRMREILFGLPALGMWQWIESRRMATRAARLPVAPVP